MSQNYTQEFKKKIVNLHVKEGHTCKSITEEYGVSKASIYKWCSEFSEECQNPANSDSDVKTELDFMKENLRLQKDLEDTKKEILSLKKSVDILFEGNRLTAYRFIEHYRELFGLNWLLKRLKIFPNAYYNYLKHRK